MLIQMELLAIKTLKDIFYSLRQEVKNLKEDCDEVALSGKASMHRKYSQVNRFQESENFSKITKYSYKLTQKKWKMKHNCKLNLR